MIEQETADILGMSLQMKIIISCIIIVTAYLVDFLGCRLFVPLARKVAVRTSFKWDNYITDSNVVHNVFHLIPPITFQVALPMLFPGPAQWTGLLSKLFNIYIIFISCRLVCEFVSSMYAISNDSDILRDKPMKGVYQMVKVIVVC